MVKHAILLALLLPLQALAQSGWFHDVDPLTGDPTDNNSGFTISVTPNDQVAFAYYTHLFEQNRPIPPTVSPQPPDPFTLDEAAGLPTWFLAVSDLFVEEGPVIVASGPVYFYPQFGGDGPANETQVGEFLAVVDQSIPEYALSIAFVENDWFSPDYDLYRLYDLQRIVLNRPEFEEAE